MSLTTEYSCDLVRPSLPPRAIDIIGSHEPDAFTIGRLITQRGGVTHRIRYGGDQGIVIIGPNGKGKGTSVLMPNLLQNAGASMFVIDPKGELAAVTALWRRSLGRVVILNPFGIHTDIPGYADLRSEGFNAFAHLDPASLSFNSDAARLADAMVTIEGNDPHWTSSARALVAALIMYVTIEARRLRQVPTMTRVRELLCQASEEPHAGNNFEGSGLPKLAFEMMGASIRGLRNKASQFTNWTKEIQSIASAAKIQTETFDDDQIANDMERGTFDFREMKKRPTTVYLILPPDEMVRHSKWLRLILTVALQATMRARLPGEPRCYFLMDEFFALGHLEIISTVWALVRGYGVQMVPVLQSLEQLQVLYPKLWQTFLGMAGVIASFAPNEPVTAKWLAERAGETTTRLETTSTSSSSGWTKSEHSSSNESTSVTTSESYIRTNDPPSFQWTPMLAFRSWRGVSDECREAPGFPGVVQA